VVELTVSDDRDRDIRYRSQTFAGDARSRRVVQRCTGSKTIPTTLKKPAGQVGRDFREATTANKSSGEIRFNNYRKSNDTSGYLKHAGTDTNERHKGSLR
jgi:hypothetical protein